MQYIKVPSGEMVNDISLRHFATLGAPILLSTGMATLEEVAHAVDVLQTAGTCEITLLHCTSIYPAPPETLNLRAIETLKNQFHLPVGYSDHSAGIHAAIAVTTMGATVIEKHFTLDRALPGPDHVASLEPKEFSEMVKLVKETASSLGNGEKKPTPQELDTAYVIRRSWRVTRDLPAGTILAETDCALKRPNDGLPCALPPFGRRLIRPLRTDAPIRIEDIC